MLGITGSGLQQHLGNIPQESLEDHEGLDDHIHPNQWSKYLDKGLNVGCFSGQFFFLFCESIFFIVAIFDLVDNVKTIHCLCYLLKAPGFFFLKCE